MSSKVIETETQKPYGNINVKSLFIGDEFSVRFVPQSLYFQNQELDVFGYNIKDHNIRKLNSNKKLIVKREISILNRSIDLLIE